MSTQTDTRRRLLVALALERSRAGSPTDGALRRALEGERRVGKRGVPQLPQAVEGRRGEPSDGPPRS